jgi:hypothetical protein
VLERSIGSAVGRAVVGIVVEPGAIGAVVDVAGGA